MQPERQNASLSLSQNETDDELTPREARTRLREAMQTEYRNFYKYGRRARVSDVVAFVSDAHPDLVAVLEQDLITRALHDMAAKVASSWAAVKDKGERQLVLPGMSKHLTERLPPALSVPVDGNVSDISFVPAQEATRAEWRAHLEYLLQQHRGLGLVIEAIQDLLARGDALSCPDNEPLVPWISKRAARA
ncbi:hypothetical protein [Microvirga massiliensis]|uniref:hypothetical protein n=1 Tax=Microvirga massiliensis TaxID=1033741 RepID=UPI00062BA195|nr:hypothetical protein [Microvirga massiliensis]